MPAGTEGNQAHELAGKVLQAGIREGVGRTSAKAYAVAWVQLLDGKLREIVEVTKWLGDTDVSPFDDLQRGQYVKLPVKTLRVFNGMLTGELHQDDAPEHEAEEQAEDAAF